MKFLQQYGQECLFFLFIVVVVVSLATGAILNNYWDHQEYMRDPAEYNRLIIIRRTGGMQ